MTDDRDTTHYHSTPGDPMRYHPLANTIANIVTAICAVAIALKIY